MVGPPSFISRDGLLGAGNAEQAKQGVHRVSPVKVCKVVGADGKRPVVLLEEGAIAGKRSGPCHVVYAGLGDWTARR